MDEPATILTLHGRAVAPGEVGPALAAAARPQSLVRCGGLVYRAALQAGRLHVAVGPAFVEGVRQYHFELPLPADDRYPVGGCINPNGTISLLFRVPRGDAAADGQFRRRCVAVARFLVSSGVAGSLRLEDATRRLLEEAAVFSSAPPTLAALAGQSLEGE